MNKQTRILLFAVAQCFAGQAYATHTTDAPTADNPGASYEGTWVAPLESSIPFTPEGDQIRYGKELLTKTYKYMTQLGVLSGYQTGNQLSCTNCHLEEGTAAWSGSWAVMWGKYGLGNVYSSRINQRLTMENRIQDCLQRSMNAQTHVLPNTSREMVSMVAYFKWLFTGRQINPATGQPYDWFTHPITGLSESKAQGFVPLKELTRATDPLRGKLIYDEQCMACHGSDGEGVWNPETQTYVYPPLWGQSSTNDGSGMIRLRTGARFIKGNMPYGWANATDHSRMLPDADVWDVMTYVVYQPRPFYWNQLNDWSCYTQSAPRAENLTRTPPIPAFPAIPDWMQKFPDAGYAMYYPRFNGTNYVCDPNAPQVYPAAQHRYGPWPAMETFRRCLIDKLADPTKVCTP